MNILIVDDQKAIVESLKNGLRWENIKIEKVFTANSAKEAKLVLVNFDIDILLLDIEMPEENGLELYQWTREKFPDIAGIFLTSHAEFTYAQKAISLGGFDYILQPARYEDVENIVKRAVVKIEQNNRIRKLETTRKLITGQKDSLMELLVFKMKQENGTEHIQTFQRLKELLGMEFDTCVFWPLVIQVQRFNGSSEKWNENLLMLVFRNIIEELFEKEKGKVCIAGSQAGCYHIFLAVGKQELNLVKWKQGLDEFYNFIDQYMDFSITVYPGRAGMERYCEEIFFALQDRNKANLSKKPGIFWDDIGSMEESVTINEERIKTAVEYIKANINKNVSRTDVARLLHLNEEYFSRLFKQYTGYTFKDYELRERINMAKDLLKHSHFSISMIASKLGYDNFSYFSKIFKKMTDMSPQEYRKEKQENKKLP